MSYTFNPFIGNLDNTGPDNIQSGSFAITIGDGILSSFNITHTLSTQDVNIQVRDLSSGEVVYPVVDVVSIDIVSLTFNIVPSIDQFRAVILSHSGKSLTVTNIGGGGASTSMPAPTLKWRKGGVHPDLFVSYTPVLTSTWLSPQTEVWVFVYRRPKKKKWSGRPDKYASGYVHPADTDKWAANAGKPLYGGDPGSNVFHTEFSFISGGQLPQPYQQVPLTAFNPLEFYKNLNTGQQVTVSNFPLVWGDNAYGIHSPRMKGSAGGRMGKNLITYYEFRFAIPNPDTSSKYPKLFGPPSYLKVRPKFINTTSGEGSPAGLGTQISFMTYASEYK